MPDDDPGPGTAPARTGAWRRGLLAGAYASLSMGLGRSLAADHAWVASTMQQTGQALPARLVDTVGDPIVASLWAMGLLLFALALGSFVVSRESGGAFAMLVVSTVAWFAFPYAEVPWAALLTGGRADPVAAPLSVWVWGGLLVAVATVEVVASGRQHLSSTLKEAGVRVGPGSAVASRSRSVFVVLVTASVSVGGAMTVLYGLLRGAAWVQLPVPDLLWVPVALGVLLALSLWVAMRRPGRA